MIIPAFYVKDLANQAMAQACLGKEEHFKAFLHADYITLDYFSAASSNEWGEYFM